MRLGYGHAHGPQRIAHAEKTVSVTFHLDDPHALTDTDQAVWELKAAKGQPLLEVAVHAGINIEHACGGVCACSTCHVYVTQGMSDCSEAEEDEEDRVEEAPGSRSTRVFAAKRSSKGMVRSSCTSHRGIATR